MRLYGLDDLDGRTKAYQYVHETIADITADLGGADHLSTLKSTNIEHTAMLAAMFRDAAVRWLQGDDLDPAAIATLQNTFKRSADALGWQRRQRDITPEQLVGLRIVLQGG